MDYQMPTPVICAIPYFDACRADRGQSGGTKGVGEAGTVGSLAATMNAVMDALSTAGVSAFEMPATPCRVWEALQAAKS